MSSPVVQTERLTRLFRGVPAVDQLSITVQAGTVFGFLGPNGSGKTTTIRLLLGLLEPSAGEATVLGWDIRSASERIRERAGALLEHHGLYLRLTAADNLEFHARVWRLDRRTRQQRIKELLGNLGLWERRHEVVAGWSRGMKQRLAVARAMLHQPELIFLDEPTAGLDPVAAASLREEILALVRGQGVTVFLTTHNLAEAERMCDSVAVLRRGQLVACGAPAELRAGAAGQLLQVTGSGWSPAALAAAADLPMVKATALRQDQLEVELVDGASAAPLVAVLVGHGVQVEEVFRGAPSLEEVFLRLVEEEGQAQ